MMLRKKKPPENAVVLLDDNRRYKGEIKKFNPRGRTLVLRQVGFEGGASNEIDMGRVAAVFFVHDLVMERTSRIERRRFPPAANTTPGRQLFVTFRWGERMSGWSEDYQADGSAFYLVPDSASDRAGNVKRVYITRAALGRVDTEPPGAENDRLDPQAASRHFLD